MADPQEHADAAYQQAYPKKFSPYTDANLSEARSHGKLAHRIEALEKEVAELKESIATKYPATAAAENPAWREHITSFDPGKYGDNPWEEMLVSLGVLYGAQDSYDTDQVKRTLARIVSIAEWSTAQQMVPSEIKPLFCNAKVLYTYFHPEGSEWEAATNPWHYGDVGQMAASWLRSLYV